MNTQKERRDTTGTANRTINYLSVPATVSDVIPGANPGEAEQARISLDGEGEPYNEIRVENPLHNSCGDTVRLAKGDHVRLNVGKSYEERSGDDDDTARPSPTKG